MFWEPAGTSSSHGRERRGEGGRREGYAAALKRLFFLSRFVAVVDTEESDPRGVTASNRYCIQDGLQNTLNRHLKQQSRPIKAEKEDKEYSFEPLIRPTLMTVLGNSQDVPLQLSPSLLRPLVTSSANRCPPGADASDFLSLFEFQQPYSYEVSCNVRVMSDLYLKTRQGCWTLCPCPPPPHSATLLPRDGSHGFRPTSEQLTGWQLLSGGVQVCISTSTSNFAKVKCI